jgi:hypothetical protein
MGSTSLAASGSLSEVINPASFSPESDIGLPNPDSGLTDSSVASVSFGVSGLEAPRAAKADVETRRTVAKIAGLLRTTRSETLDIFL